MQIIFNPLNTELNPICHFLVLLGDLTFMGPCILSIFHVWVCCGWPRPPTAHSNQFLLFHDSSR